MIERHPKSFYAFIKLGEKVLSDSDQVSVCLLLVFGTLIEFKAITHIQFEKRGKPSTCNKLLWIPTNFMILGFLSLVEESFNNMLIEFGVLEIYLRKLL